MTEIIDDTPCPTCGRQRIEWTERHKRHATILEKGFAGVVTLLGIAVFSLLDGRAQSAGMVVAGVGLFMCFPPLRPLFSNIADRLPFLASKTDK